MKDQINYQALFAIEQDIQAQVSASPAFKLFHREKIKRFTQNNQYRLNVLHTTIDKLRDQYVKKDKEGKLVTKDVEGQLQFEFENESDKTNYLDEWNEFMKITFDLHV